MSFQTEAEGKLMEFMQRVDTIRSSKPAQDSGDGSKIKTTERQFLQHEGSPFMNSGDFATGNNGSGGDGGDGGGGGGGGGGTGYDGEAGRTFVLE